MGIWALEHARSSNVTEDLGNPSMSTSDPPRDEWDMASTKRPGSSPGCTASSDGFCTWLFRKTTEGERTRHLAMRRWDLLLGMYQGHLKVRSLDSMERHSLLDFPHLPAVAGSKKNSAWVYCSSHRSDRSSAKRPSWRLYSRLHNRHSVNPWPLHFIFFLWSKFLHLGTLPGQRVEPGRDGSYFRCWSLPGGRDFFHENSSLPSGCRVSIPKQRSASQPWAVRGIGARAQTCIRLGRPKFEGEKPTWWKGADADSQGFIF